jgi:hypothetical protein
MLEIPSFTHIWGDFGFTRALDEYNDSVSTAIFVPNSVRTIQTYVSTGENLGFYTLGDYRKRSFDFGASGGSWTNQLLLWAGFWFQIQTCS